MLVLVIQSQYRQTHSEPVQHKDTCRQNSVNTIRTDCVSILMVASPFQASIARHQVVAGHAGCLWALFVNILCHTLSLSSSHSKQQSRVANCV